LVIDLGEVKMNLSDQAMGAIMMALQKSLLEQSDIVPVLKNFNFVLSDEHELNVTNPPTFKVDRNQEVNVTVGSD
jgi:hypothetical protein|tara:strand:+ start:1063 stop:1287 length:225 start_codon:yes stop_codon:yes gene_type:complete